MKKKSGAIIIFMLIATFLHAQSPPKRELRAAWVATYFGIDWPNKTQTPQQQRDAFIVLANHHQVTGMNTLYIQVRSQCDAMYPSSIEPWSSDLTGTQGVAPSPLWDPMLFMINECHKRGMEFHAWLNPYRAVGNTANLPSFSSTHVAKQHPEWMLTVGTVQILNPGIPEVRDYIISVIVDILQRYDVDGIHFDDYFYPSGTINDDAAYAADPRGFTVRADWRRDNINLLIKRVYDSVLSIKPWVKFGVSPSGIYRNSTNPAIGSNTSGLEHYTTYYADTKKWLQQQWIDYLCPQIYWYIGQAGSDYSILANWWNNNSFGRHIYMGMAGYKVGDPGEWQSNTQIPSQMRLNRSYSNIYGEAIYNTTSLKTNKLGFRDSIRLFFYQKPALLPLMSWRDNTAPSAPSALTATRYAGDSVVLNWTKPAAATNELDKAKRFVIYRSLSSVIDLNDANNIVAITPSDTTAFKDSLLGGASTVYYYTVTSLDRFQNESLPSNKVQTPNNAVPLVLTDFSVRLLDKDFARIDWQTEQEMNVEMFEVLRSTDGNNFTVIGNKIANNRNTRQYYSLSNTITGLSGPLFYKLKITDKDGTSRFGPVKKLSIDKAAGWVKVFPTVINSGSPLQVNITSTSQEKVFYHILNLKGQLLSTGTMNGNDFIDTRKLSAGNYVIQLSQGDKVENIQFVVQ